MATSSTPRQKTQTSDGPPQRRAEPEQPNERQQREARILDAAAALLVRWGYRKTTIDDVAREAGVGKGTIYLHWKDKNELFRSAIWREEQRYIEEVKQRINADPQGGLLHRVTAHSMMALLDVPLMGAMFTGKTDLYSGILGAVGPDFIDKLVADTDAWLVQLQQAGLVRSNLSAPIITYLMTAMKLGVIYLPEMIGQKHMPPMEVLTEAMSDLVRRWLEPEQLPSDTEAGKRSFAELLDRVPPFEDQVS